jgi:hypothetical protein
MCGVSSGTRIKCVDFKLDDKLRVEKKLKSVPNIKPHATEELILCLFTYPSKDLSIVTLTNNWAFFCHLQQNLLYYSLGCQAILAYVRKPISWIEKETIKYIYIYT